MRFLSPSVVPAVCMSRWIARRRALRSAACSKERSPGRACIRCDSKARRRRDEPVGASMTAVEVEATELWAAMQSSISSCTVVGQSRKGGSDEGGSP